MLIKTLRNRIDNWASKTLTRSRMPIIVSNANVIMIDSVPYINFSSNDYLGLEKHPKIMAAYLRGVQDYGLGSGASALVSGYYAVHKELEMQFADWLNVDKALLFSSGYLANIGTVAALTGRHSTIFSDKLCHASLLDGIQLSRAKHYRFQHNSLSDLARLSQFKTPDLIITEGVFSMEGDLSPVKDILALANKIQASVIVDDAHGIGVLGEKGKGICEQAGIDPKQLACLIAPLGKAFNAMGAIVAGQHDIIESVLQFARSYRYSTGLPPAIASALLTTLNVIKAETWRRRSLHELVAYFIEYALKKGLTISSTDLTPIKSIIIGDSSKVVRLQKIMLSKGFYISCIRPPTVQENSARVRVSLNCLHSEAQVASLLDAISGALLNE
jgi:8-amino-7-oxononanoate synthase